MAVSAENFEVLEDEAPSDEEFSKEAHHKLLNAVSRLYKKQRIEAPKRREPVQEISEFNLSSGVEGESKVQTVDVNELLGDLKERATHRDITRKVRFAQNKAKKLPKPLEKIQEQKITRSVGYENVKEQLNKWSSIVERNKLASQLIFPLEQKKIKKKASYNFLTTFKEPTELEKEMAKVLNQSEIAKEERKEEKMLSKLSVEEMIERRNMMAKMRARESYRISKAARQNKIKSKKYHRILKKEKIKQELKDFEKLQKTDPEAALEKLEQIERARAQERISLRHRNTGKWARSKAIRAKYDTEARIQLAEQLAKSRELTKKLKENNSSSENETEDEHSDNEGNRNTNTPLGNYCNATNNPWVSEYQQFVSDYKKFSTTNSQDNSRGIELNKKNEKMMESEPNKSMENSEVANDCSLSLNVNKQRLNDEMYTTDITDEANSIITETSVKIVGSKDPLVQQSGVCDGSVNLSEEEEEVLEIGKLNASVNVDIENNSKSNEKLSINDIFEEAEDALQNHASANVEKLKSNLDLEDDLDEDEGENETETRKFEFKKSTRLHDIDAALIEVADEGISSGQNDLRDLKEKLNKSESTKEKELQIDPNKLINVKPQKLSSELPDFDENGDDSEDDEKQKHLNLMEAFAEDDIVDQFREEKKAEEKSSKPKAVDLELPGWGSWGGTSVQKKSKRRTRRFMVKFSKLPRKDKKKPNVIINEDPVPKLREQMVSELPYPFTSVRDFEASIRAPIGKHWVTEKSFKKLTAPPVVTKMGTIIEPMSNSMLASKPKKRLNSNKPNVNFKKKKYSFKVSDK